MRGNPLRNAPGFLPWFLGALVAGFVLQTATASFGTSFVSDHGSLSADGLRKGAVWSLLTYVLLHGSVFHFLLNGLGVFFWAAPFRILLVKPGLPG